MACPVIKFLNVQLHNQNLEFTARLMAKERQQCILSAGIKVIFFRLGIAFPYLKGVVLLWMFLPCFVMILNLEQYLFPDFQRIKAFNEERLSEFKYHFTFLTHKELTTVRASIPLASNIGQICLCHEGFVHVFLN